jgi:hypothetical protein
MENQKLKDYFKFDEADLQANRQGLFSDAQKKKISLDQANSFHVDVWLAGIAIPFGMILLGWMFYSIFRGVGGFARTGGLIINLGIWGSIVLIIGLLAFRAMFARHQYKLAKVQGPINIVREEVHGSHGHTSVYHELHIGGREFSVDEGLADVMMQGDEYIIYYDMDGDEMSGILSAEFVSKAK